MKVVINRCFGGFGLSDAALDEYKSRKGITDENFRYYDIARDCPVLVDMIEEQGTAINGFAAELKVVEIPDGINWFIEDFDGLEHVAERHRTWY